MRPLLRLIVALTVLGAVVGCADSEMEARKAECAEWVPEHRGGSCAKTWAEVEEDYLFDLAEEQARRHEEERVGRSAGNYLDCEDFASRADAQAYLDSNPHDPNYLDGDGDGIACEWGTN
jgi:hypothetical protein